MLVNVNAGNLNNEKKIIRKDTRENILRKDIKERHIDREKTPQIKLKHLGKV